MLNSVEVSECGFNINTSRHVKSKPHTVVVGLLWKQTDAMTSAPGIMPRAFRKKFPIAIWPATRCWISCVLLRDTMDNPREWMHFRCTTRGSFRGSRPTLRALRCWRPCGPPPSWCCSPRRRCLWRCFSSCLRPRGHESYLGGRVLY